MSAIYLGRVGDEIMTKYARLAWEVEIPDKPTEKQMQKAMQKLSNMIMSYLSDHPTIDDIEMCDTPYEIKGERFEGGAS